MNDLKRGNVKIICFMIAFLTLFTVIMGINTRKLGATVPHVSCSTCHVMHKAEDDYLAGTDDARIRNALLNSTCIGCHTGTNDGVDSYPYVLSTTPPIYDNTGTENTTNTLAGGNFYWVKYVSDRKGHNVKDIATPDVFFGQTPPGFIAGWGSSGVGNDWETEEHQLTCAGTYGCHGRHDSEFETEAIKRSHHHGRDGAIADPDPEKPGDGYRMLLGIAGNEDPDWEYQPTSSEHNQYKGTHENTGGDKSTISYLCAECHPAYHDSISPWSSHPSDYDMSESTKIPYQKYGGLGINEYQVVTPVGSSDVSTVIQYVEDNNSTMIVTCITCHRAHGTSWDYSLRWNYTGEISSYCLNCHDN